jgi:hypothetical protein
MTYTVKASWLTEHESEYDSLDDAAGHLRALLDVHTGAAGWIEGEGVVVSVQPSAVPVVHED